MSTKHVTIELTMEQVGMLLHVVEQYAEKVEAYTAATDSEKVELLDQRRAHCARYRTLIDILQTKVVAGSARYTFD